MIESHGTRLKDAKSDTVAELLIFKHVKAQLQIAFIYFFCYRKLNFSAFFFFLIYWGKLVSEPDYILIIKGPEYIMYRALVTSGIRS